MNPYTSIEYIIAFGILTTVGVLFLTLYLIICFSTKIKEKNIFLYKLRYIFFILSISSFNLSVMPILVNAGDYKTKRVFEFTETIFFAILIYMLLMFIKDIINYINQNE